MSGKAEKSPSSGDHDNAGVIAHPPLIYLGGLLLGLACDWGLGLPALPLPGGVGGHALAAVPGVLGAVLLFAAAARFIRAGTNIPTHRPTTALVTEGLYRFSRNPIYLGLTLIYLSLALGFSSLASLALLPIVLRVMQVGVIQREERYLERKFGESYLAYKSRVRRWL